MMYTDGAQSPLDLLFMSRGHFAGGHGAPVLTESLSELTATHCRLSLCRTEDAAAQEMSPKLLVRTVRTATRYTPRISSTVSSDAGVNLTLNV